MINSETDAVPLSFMISSLSCYLTIYCYDNAADCDSTMDDVAPGCYNDFT